MKGPLKARKYHPLTGQIQPDEEVKAEKAEDKINT
jgi:hypothetical protein